MGTSHRIAGLSFVLTALSLSPALAQVVRTSKGAVEFFGLEKWSPQEIQKKLGYSSPDQMHYCAADLEKLGFADVSVIGTSEDGRRYTFITVVEPQRRSEVVYRTQPNGHVASPTSWQVIRKAVSAADFLSGGVLDYVRMTEGADKRQPWLADGVQQSWWDAARALDTDSDYRLALQVLNGESDRTVRATAAVVLMNFAGHDEAWRSLVRSVRDPDVTVRTTASQALNSLATYVPRKVDWQPVWEDIAHALRGTNLFALRFLLKELTATQIDPALSSLLLSNGGGRLVLSYLRAQEDHEARDLAHGFLVQLRGSDLGTDADPWESWIDGLSKAKAKK